MTMKNVYMVEYQGRCDENGKAVGHAPKVLNEYFNFIKDYTNVTVFAPKPILAEFDSANASTVMLDKHIVMKGKTPFLEKITNKLTMFSNASKAYKSAAKDSNSIVWFFNVEYFVMLWFAFSPYVTKASSKKMHPKVVVTMFFDGFHADKNASVLNKFNTSFKQWVFERAQQKFDLIIATGEKFSYKNTRSVFIPDYYYIPEVFDKYREAEKKNEAVCLGTMGKGKQLKEMVEAFSRIGYPLTIAGRFYDKNLVEELKKNSSDNIKIIDEYLTNDEYLSLLSKAKYTILPYPSNYATQTSGVMQEAIFLNTIPVTYTSILNGNCILGIGFDSWDELNGDMLETSCSKIIEEYNNKINGAYSKAYATENYKKIFKN